MGMFSVRLRVGDLAKTALPKWKRWLTQAQSTASYLKMC